VLRRIVKIILAPFLNKKVQFIDKDVALENLANAKKILDRLNVRNWLTDGTLLGYFRENDFIGYDVDVDMGCFIDDYTDEILHSFIDNGWRVEQIFGKRDIGFELAFIRDNVKLDIFFFYEEGQLFWHGAWKNTPKGLNLIKYYYDKFELSEIKFKGNIFNIPTNTEKYIMTKYGEDWKTPKKNWDWSFGPSNAVRTEFYL
jgi:fukutin